MIFKRHSTRVVSTSDNYKMGIEIATILKSAGWKNAELFALHYDKPIIEEIFSEAIQRERESAA